MVVPIDLLKPILDHLLRHGRPNRPARPWLGFDAAEIEGRIVVIGVADRGPGPTRGPTDRRRGAEGRRGEPRPTSPTLFRRIWSLGHAGTEIPLRIERDGHSFDQTVTSSERNRFFKVPRMH